MMNSNLLPVLSKYFESRKRVKKCLENESDDFIPLPATKEDNRKLCVIGINECLKSVENTTPLLVIINNQIEYKCNNYIVL